MVCFYWWFYDSRESAAEWYPFLITLCHILRTRISLPPLTYCLPDTFHVKTFIGTLLLTLQILGIFFVGIRAVQIDDLFLVTFMELFIYIFEFPCITSL